MKFVFAALLLAGCSTIQPHASCSVPADLTTPDQITMLPSRDLTLDEVVRLWAQERAEHRKVIDRKQDLVNFVETHCK